MAVSK